MGVTDDVGVTDVADDEFQRYDAGRFQSSHVKLQNLGPIMPMQNHIVASYSPLSKYNLTSF